MQPSKPTIYSKASYFVGCKVLAMPDRLAVLRDRHIEPPEVIPTFGWMLARGTKGGKRVGIVCGDSGSGKTVTMIQTTRFAAEVPTDLPTLDPQHDSHGQAVVVYFTPTDLLSANSMK